MFQIVEQLYFVLSESSETALFLLDLQIVVLPETTWGGSWSIFTGCYCTNKCLQQKYSKWCCHPHSTQAFHAKKEKSKRLFNCINYIVYAEASSKALHSAGWRSLLMKIWKSAVFCTTWSWKSEPEMCRILGFEFGLIFVHAADLNFGLCKSKLCIWEEEVLSNAEVVTGMLMWHSSSRTWHSALVFEPVLNKFAQDLEQPCPEYREGYLCDH